MRNTLFILALTVFGYSPFEPNWDRDLVNTGIELTLFSFYSKCLPKALPPLAHFILPHVFSI